MSKQKPSKKEISEFLDGVSPYEFDNTLGEIRKKIDAWIIEYGTDAYLDYCSYGYQDYSDTPGYHLKRKRLETDAEFAARVEQERVQSDMRTAHERAEYERLRKQFEGK